MIVVLMRRLRSFRGPKTRVRCFLHVINLVAALIIRQLEDRKLKNAGGALGESDNEVEGNESDNDDIEELEELLIEEDDEDEAVEPVRTAINKVSVQP